MAVKRRALIGYRYGRMCMRAQAAGRRAAGWLAGVFLTGVLVGAGVALVASQTSPHAYANCLLEHADAGASRDATFQITRACADKYPPPPDFYR